MGVNHISSPILRMIQIAHRMRVPFSGFTLVELIVTLSIIAILGTIAFVSVNGYLSNSRDAGRIANVDIMAKGFDVTLAAGTLINTSKTATGYNFVITGSGLTMTGYYGVVNDTLLWSIKVFGKDIAVYDGFQEYRYSYFPTEWKYQVLATLENPENARSVFVLPSFVDQALAASGSVGYAFIKGNYTATGGINNIIVDGATWNGTPPVGGITTLSGGQTITTGTALALVPATGVPADGACGSANTAIFTTTPTLNLCSVGTSTGILDHGGVNGKWTWGCTGVNGGNTTTVTSCSANLDTSVHCIFDDPASLSLFGDGTTNYCTFAP